MNARYVASKAAPAHRQPCRCPLYRFPHRPETRCDALPSVRDPMSEERAAFFADQARGVNEYR